MKDLSIVEESNPKMVNMANLCIISCHKINGVSNIHTELLKNKIFKSFYEMTPRKFLNITNGCSPRRLIINKLRWIRCANKELSNFYYKYLSKLSNKIYDEDKDVHFKSIDWLIDI